jgi:hypothetical protein
MYNPFRADCLHCGEPVKIRNPSGYCDHLYYPDNCEYCKKLVPLVRELLKRFDGAWKKLGKK